MDLSATPEVFTEQVKTTMLQISSKRGVNRTDFITSIATQVGRFIGQQQYEITKLKNKLIMCDSDVVTKLLAEKEKLEQEAAYDKKWKARYKRHHERQAEEIEELKKQLGIPKVPWYEQGQDDPPEKVN